MKPKVILAVTLLSFCCLLILMYRFTRPTQFTDEYTINASRYIKIDDKLGLTIQFEKLALRAKDSTIIITAKIKLNEPAYSFKYLNVNCIGLQVNDNSNLDLRRAELDRFTYMLGTDIPIDSQTEKSLPSIYWAMKNTEKFDLDFVERIENSLEIYPIGISDNLCKILSNTKMSL